jgi:hypothetical protein
MAAEAFIKSLRFWVMTLFLVSAMLRVADAENEL